MLYERKLVINFGWNGKKITGWLENLMTISSLHNTN
ncbi:MAG: hypothetical protein MRERV_36c027 [Mycoplasmataceae bacterium RV_VA103A]|nr:MAG: hypothetical protein MRERV_36c027 [Mycoplasmataceae bacterium RV_VA103A]